MTGIAQDPVVGLAATGCCAGHRWLLRTEAAGGRGAQSLKIHHEGTKGTKDTKKTRGHEIEKKEKTKKELLLAPCPLRALRAFVVNLLTISTYPRSLCVLRASVVKSQRCPTATRASSD
jgi:hypothetical protein